MTILTGVRPALAACRLEGAAAVPVTMAGLRPTVHASLNGRDAVFVIDSGAVSSAVSPEAVERYRLPELGFTTVHGSAGAVPAERTRVEILQMGGATFIGTPFLVVRGAGADVAGVIGQDVLSSADVEYDFANGVMRLIRTRGCGDKDILSYWTDQPAILPLTLGAAATGALNGQPVRVALDSGTAYSGMTLAAAARAGVTPQNALPATAVTGAGGGATPSWTAPFDSFALGPEAVLHTRLRIGPADLGGADLLLGADFFLSHRIYVAQGQHRLYFTYNGGPVFRLREPSAVATAFKDAPAGDPNAPQDASGFARRAAASSARGDPARAVTDLTRAIALEPRSADWRLDRARAHAADGHGDLALEDYAAGLKLKPGDPRILAARAALLIDSGQTEAARADLDAASAARDPGPILALDIAALYERADLFPQAVAAFGRWLAANRRAELEPNALSGRCRARVLMHGDLALARQDCDAAARLAPKDPAILADRALLRLALQDREGAAADAGAALTLDPASPWALHVRGRARLALGQSAEGRADLAAAAAADPKQSVRAARLGFAPPVG